MSGRRKSRAASPRLKAPGPKRGEVDPRTALEAEREAREREFEERKQQQLAEAAIKLDAIDAEMLRYQLNYSWITQREIAALLRLSRRAVQKRLAAPKYKRAMDLAKQPALEIYRSNQPRAARVLGELLNSNDDRIRIRAAIAELWPYIHRASEEHGQADFVSFIQEAFELAQAEKGTSGPPPTIAIASSSRAGAASVGTPAKAGDDRREPVP